MERKRRAGFSVREKSNVQVALPANAAFILAEASVIHGWTSTSSGENDTTGR
jgi:hypothetical protein